LERIRLEQEASERAEMERIKAEQQKVHEEQERVRMEQETIKKAQEAEVRKIQEMKDELEREKERNRLQKLELNIAEELAKTSEQFFKEPVPETLFPETKNEKESFEVLAKAVERFPATDEHEEKNLMKDDASLLLEELEFMINEFPILDAIKVKVSTLKKIKTCLENFMFPLNANK
jgi:hypothetical protein